MTLVSSRTLSDAQINFFKTKWEKRLIDITTLGGVPEYISLNYAATYAVIGYDCSEEEQFYTDMRNAIRELEQEELEQKQCWWQQWFTSYCVEGLF